MKPPDKNIPTISPNEVLGRPFSLLVSRELRSQLDAILTGLKEKRLTGRLETLGRAKER